MCSFKIIKKVIIFLLCVAQISSISAITLKEVQALVYKYESESTFDNLYESNEVNNFKNTTYEDIDIREPEFVEKDFEDDYDKDEEEKYEEEYQEEGYGYKIPFTDTFTSKVNIEKELIFLELDQVEEWLEDWNDNESNRSEIEEQLINLAGIEAEVFNNNDLDTALDNIEVGLEFVNLEEIFSVRDYFWVNPDNPRRRGKLFKLEVKTSNTFKISGGSPVEIDVIEPSEVFVNIIIDKGDEIVFNSLTNENVFFGVHSIVMDYSEIKYINEQFNPQALLRQYIFEYSRIYYFGKNVETSAYRSVTANIGVRDVPELEGILGIDLSGRNELIDKRSIRLFLNTAQFSGNLDLTRPIDVVIVDAEERNADIDHKNNEAYIVAYDFVTRVDKLKREFLDGNIRKKIGNYSNVDAMDVRRNIDLWDTGRVTINSEQLVQDVINWNFGDEWDRDKYELEFKFETGDRFEDLTSTIWVRVKAPGDVHFENSGLILSSDNFAINIDDENNNYLFDNKFELKAEHKKSLSKTIILNEYDFSINEDYEVEILKGVVPKEVGVYQVDLSIEGRDQKDEEIFKDIYVTIYDDNSVYNYFYGELLIGNGFEISLQDAKQLNTQSFLQESNARAYHTDRIEEIDVKILTKTGAELDFNNYEWKQGNNNIRLVTETGYTEMNIVVYVYDDLELSADNFDIFLRELNGVSLSDEEIIRRSGARLYYFSNLLNDPIIKVEGNVPPQVGVHKITLKGEHENHSTSKTINVTVKGDSGSGDIGSGNIGSGRAWGTPSFPNMAVQPQQNEEVFANTNIVRHEVEMEIGNSQMFINGFSREMDVAPYIQNNRTMVPVRFLSYGFFIPTENIHWDETKRLVTIIDGTTKIEITVGEEIMYVNGEAVSLGESDLDTAVAEIKNNRVFVPIRPIAEALNVNLEWTEETQTVRFYREIEM